EGLSVRFISNLRSAAIGEGRAFGRVFVYQFPLERREPGLHDRLHVAVLQILVTNRTMAELLDNVSAFFHTYSGQAEIGTPLRKAIQPQYPLLDGVIPPGKLERSVQDLLREQMSRRLRRWRLDPPTSHNKVSKSNNVLRPDSHRDSIKAN